MYYKKYGDTDMLVSAVGMGAMRYDEEDVKAGRFEKCAEVALYAHEKGINFFDSAPFYCDDKSEIITGIALSQLPRDSYYISSKMNLGTVGGKCDADDFKRRLENSLTRLKVDYLDFYYLWCMLDLESYKKQYDILYKYFEQAKKDGLIKNITFSSHMQGNDLEKVIETDAFKGMLIGYNALNYRFRQAGITAAHNRGMGIVVMNPLGGGLIPSNQKTFSYLAEGTDLTVPQAALRFVASHKEITVTLAGITTKQHVDDAVKSVENLVEKPAKEICAEFESKGVALNNLCTGCAYCKGCPADIDIPKFMDAYNEKLLGNSIENRIKWHWGIPMEKAAECIKCGQCETLCTQHLNIMDRLDEIALLRG
ncbi:aldo/keto reductase [Mobilitalea sibirica]|uniref:Aldo/keto reductase n=1 Tax=Mobilitalea sibirica TaxID=1462919 RepID=A0A8J7H187_9FIRM|nr:aldo/keto reductase [Mobilitalea sibirica]MBH1940078.1 aldo/keto reductase [Mobilitalea sibirica]